jgi:hypothetical protein
MAAWHFQFSTPLVPYSFCSLALCIAIPALLIFDAIIQVVSFDAWHLNNPPS